MLGERKKKREFSTWIVVNVTVHSWSATHNYSSVDISFFFHFAQVLVQPQVLHDDRCLRVLSIRIFLWILVQRFRCYHVWKHCNLQWHLICSRIAFTLTNVITANLSNKEYNFSGNEIVPYESPRPPAGIHRIVFVLFKQQARQTVYAPGWRQNFNIRDFSAIYNLGAPVAALYFNCQKESGVGGRR